MDIGKAIAELKKFIGILEKNSTSSSSSSKFIFHRYLGGNLDSIDSKIGEIFFILQSSITMSKEGLTSTEVNKIIDHKIHSNSFLLPSDSEFTPILNYFFRNRDEFTKEQNEIISFLHEKIQNLQNSIWIENSNVFSFGNRNSIQPDCTINFMEKNDNLAFIFQINNLNLLFNESKEISILNKKISLLNKKIERNHRKENVEKTFEDKQESYEKTIQKLNNDLISTKNEFKSKIAQLYQNLQRIESENAESISENKQLKLENQNFRESIQKLEEECQNLKDEKDVFNEENEMLRENIEESNLKISDLSEEIKNLEILNSELKSSNTELSDKNEALEVKIKKKILKIKEILNEWTSN
ncbi:coiled-coil domain-containing protein [Promethearchaeum syntrophicum]|uniref:Coiled-coil domain-containing protein n=1 Tax=Promethearchaeum syntrophicum TaxID=2594042 RepID=A0A5B9DAE4_9ARCH|nr:hypothetical protein [Candidatus Prometheoarchaeum syntrophicum]QEE15925.1 hypothetical protein DSAG12_01752 [Candidatus Prometheoarchaeum syntrophicum]